MPTFTTSHAQLFVANMIIKFVLSLKLYLKTIVKVMICMMVNRWKILSIMKQIYIR